MKEAKDLVVKTRAWATILYPESAAEGWREILRGWCVKAFVSPLHDQDVDPGGARKKPHWHLLCMWDGPRTRVLVERAFAQLGGVGCEPCTSVRGYARYLCHLDNPEKHRYSEALVEAYGGADFAEVIASDGDRRRVIAEMMDWCSDTGCTSFRALCDYARTERPVWFWALTSHSTLIMYRYVRSLEHELELELRNRSK